MVKKKFYYWTYCDIMCVSQHRAVTTETDFILLFWKKFVRWLGRHLCLNIPRQLYCTVVTSRTGSSGTRANMALLYNIIYNNWKGTQNPLTYPPPPPSQTYNSDIFYLEPCQFSSYPSFNMVPPSFLYIFLYSLLCF
jgi:hypothetical protein